MVKQRIVVKVGSNVLTDINGMPDRETMQHVVLELANLHRAGNEVLLITSGAVAFGRSLLPLDDNKNVVAVRQLLSAVGQASLIESYRQLFKPHSILCAQVLVTKEDFRDREHFLNMKNCLDIQLRERVIPIVNENDTVAITELMFTDNDELSVLIAAMMDADRLIMLTNVDGLYDADPTLNHAQLLTKINSDKDLSNFVSNHKSSLGRGGMLNKSAMAKKAAKLGIQVHIANGKYINVLTDLLANEIKHTIFESAKKASAKKRWLAHAGHLIKANIIVDNGVSAVINESIARSILPVGILEITGDFVKGDLVEVLNAEGTKLGIGQTSYDSRTALERIGKHHQRPLIHHDYFFKYQGRNKSNAL